MTPIETAVFPLKAAAMQAAGEFAEGVVAKVAKELAVAGWNRNVVAPYPSSMSESKASYQQKVGKYKLVCGLTVSEKGSYRPGEPVIVSMSPDKGAKFIQGAKESAAEQYELYVAKLVGKVGPVQSAALQGNAVWSLSYLKVVKENGEAETWKTRMILNVSKLGKIFNQWPTRKVK